MKLRLVGAQQAALRTLSELAHDELQAWRGLGGLLRRRAECEARHARELAAGDGAAPVRPPNVGPGQLIFANFSRIFREKCMQFACASFSKKSLININCRKCDRF